MKYAVLTLLLLCFLFDLQAVPAQVNKEKDEMQEVEISTEKTKQTGGVHCAGGQARLETGTKPWWIA